MTVYLPRSAWKARTARGSTALVASAVEGAALHWPGMAKPINATGDAGKARVASALRGWQNYHMDTRGWSDIAYMIAIDQAGRAWTLRGLNIRSGANGDADVNRRFGAFLLVLAPGEQPSAAMIATTKGVIADFRKRFPKARLKPYGHQDVRPRNSDGDKTTDCPGPIAEKAITDGKFTPSITPTDAPPKGSTTMALTAADITAIRAAVQAELEEYGSRFWTQATGTGTALINDVNDIQATVHRIEDDVDTTAPKA